MLALQAYVDGQAPMSFLPYAAAFALGSDGQALSASSLIQALIPLAPAFRLYDALSCAVQRKSILEDARSFGGFGGLPVRFGLSMADKCTDENNP